jgi:hypothetical protein
MVNDLVVLVFIVCVDRVHGLGGLGRVDEHGLG